MPRRSGLGRGLDALIPSPEEEPGASTPDGAAAHAGGAAPPNALRDVPVEAIRSNRFQPRQQFVDADMDELTESVRALGVLQPLLLRADPAGGFELIAGERRWRAAKAAGLATVPAVVRDAEDRDALEQALVENLQRSDLNPLEEAVAYQQLADLFDLKQEEVAARVGKSRPAVANTLRLLLLAPELQDLVRSGVLTAGHGRALLALDGDSSQQVALAHRAVKEGWSVRQVEREVKKLGARTPPAPAQPRGGAGRSAAVLELEELLSAHLDTTVSVKMADSGGRGKITIDFAGQADLERVYRAMTVGRERD